MAPKSTEYCIQSYKPLAMANLSEPIRDRTRPVPQFVDGSCRREPDFESEYPSISSLCRTYHYAPHLRVGSEILYIAQKHPYLEGTAHWRAVAHLKVIEIFPSHEEGAKWYRAKGLKIPSNCMVQENGPLAWHLTARPQDEKFRGLSLSERIAQWDADYQKRATSWPVFLACEVVEDRRKLHFPNELSSQDFMRFLGRIPRTRLGFESCNQAEFKSLADFAFT